MFASIKVNAFFSGLIMTGCVCSPEFAAAVVAGALGTCVATLVIFAINGQNPVSAAVNKTRSFVGL